MILQLLIMLCRKRSRIKFCIRDTDIFGRLSNEEFILLCPYADATSAANLAHRIKNTISDVPVHINKKNIFITVSIGISTTENQSYSLDDLLGHADMALDKAKESGKNRFQIYSS